jgi:hypothetical protein
MFFEGLVHSLTILGPDSYALVQGGSCSDMSRIDSPNAPPFSRPPDISKSYTHALWGDMSHFGFQVMFRFFSFSDPFEEYV